MWSGRPTLGHWTPEGPRAPRPRTRSPGPDHRRSPWPSGRRHSSSFRRHPSPPLHSCRPWRPCSRRLRCNRALRRHPCRFPARCTRRKRCTPPRRGHRRHTPRPRRHPPCTPSNPHRGSGTRKSRHPRWLRGCSCRRSAPCSPARSPRRRWPGWTASCRTRWPPRPAPRRGRSPSRRSNTPWTTLVRTIRPFR